MASGKRVAIIGAGRVGSTLGERLLAAGWAVQYGSRSGHSRKLTAALGRQEGARGGTVPAAVEWASQGEGGSGAVILAVPGSALASDAACAEFARSLGRFAAGQVVLDATNPLGADASSLVWQRGRSCAEALAECLPGEPGAGMRVLGFAAAEARCLASSPTGVATRSSPPSTSPSRVACVQGTPGALG